MITLYTWTTPNGRKISVALEEMGLEYEVKPVNIGSDEQFQPAFLAVSPNNKIPAIVDHDGPGDPVSVFESGAILVYLAEKSGKFLPASGAARAKVLEWLFWQVGGIGPMLGQLNYFAMRAPERVPLAVDRFRDEAVRLLAVMEKRLAVAPYLGGDEYSIADMATYPWVSAALGLVRGAAGEAMPATPSVDRWIAELAARPAVQKGMAVPVV
jgi:GSH-dependent disulfide-bond oxidoreductase